ncbi:hypothetical protein [Citrobacter portucalensis]|uniref:hypothetical protein n=1 Tax=Citrobacter portucalensis TaxID=1639133 RepID=UPI00226B4FAC|nr:hypothetical protein [Citrobacter portucalensis]MCX8985822.1 hypothetical protein [Citrobacter portucalensis]
MGWPNSVDVKPVITEKMSVASRHKEEPGLSEKIKSIRVAQKNNEKKVDAIINEIIRFNLLLNYKHNPLIGTGPAAKMAQKTRIKNKINNLTRMLDNTLNEQEKIVQMKDKLLNSRPGLPRHMLLEMETRF